MNTIAQIWRYPVKSMAGERLERATISFRGIPGDRGWAVFDEARGGITNAKRLQPLRMCRPRYASEPVLGEASPGIEIALPDGASVRSDSSEAAERLSALVGRAVSLRSLGPAGTETPPRLVLSQEPPEVIRELSGLEPGEPEPDFSELPPGKLRQLRQGNFFDAMPIHLVTRTSLDTLTRIAPDVAWDERRFRMNLLVDTDSSDPYPELGWVGRRVRIGTAVIDVKMGCPRCVMSTQAADELPHDPRVMRTLVRETHHIVGIYAGVAEEGEARVGDPVEVL